jgi:hypothetical protein
VSEPSFTHDLLRRHLTAAFGEPDHLIGKDSHWALRPQGRAVSINVLINGTPEAPVVWVFDPYDGADGACGSLVRSHRDADQVIATIRQRLERAAKRC